MQHAGPEVRNLAGRSPEAAKEIESLIGASVERVEQSAALVDQAGLTMAEVVGSIKRVTDIVAEISAASAEQSAGVSQLGTAVSQMDQVTQQNAALVEESAAASETLEGAGAATGRSVASFRLSQGDAAHDTGENDASTLASAAFVGRAGGAGNSSDITSNEMRTRLY